METSILPHAKISVRSEVLLTREKKISLAQQVPILRKDNAAALGPLGQQLGNLAFTVVGVSLPVMLTLKSQIGRWVDPTFQKPYGEVQMVVKRTTPAVSGALLKSRAPRMVGTKIAILRKINGKSRNDLEMKGWKMCPPFYTTRKTTRSSGYFLGILSQPIRHRRQLGKAISRSARRATTRSSTGMSALTTLFGLSPTLC